MHEDNLVIISQGRRPFWHSIIAAIFYTATLYVIVQMIHYYSIRWITVGNELILLAGLLLSGGIQFSAIRTLYINFANEKLRTEYKVWTFKTSYNSAIPQLDYVSVFKKNEESPFEVNIWYKGNRHFDVALYEDFKSAYNLGVMLSSRLKIELLDSTVKGNSKWIDNPAILQ